MNDQAIEEEKYEEIDEDAKETVKDINYKIENELQEEEIPLGNNVDIDLQNLLDQYTPQQLMIVLPSFMERYRDPFKPTQNDHSI